MLKNYMYGLNYIFYSIRGDTMCFEKMMKNLDFVDVGLINSGVFAFV